MKSFLNLILITFACSVVNAATSSGLKTIPVTSGLKTIPSSSIKTNTASLPQEIKHYTTFVLYNNSRISTILPNNAIPLGASYCVPTKGYVPRVKESCHVSSSLTYCRPEYTSIFKGSTYCSVGTKTLSFTIPVTTKSCYHTFEQCTIKTRKFSKTILPSDDYYIEVINRNNGAKTTNSKMIYNSNSSNSVATSSVELLSYVYDDCNYTTEERECVYPQTDYNLLITNTPTPLITTTPTIISTTEVPSEILTEKDTTTSPVSFTTIDNTLILPPKPTLPITFPPKDTESISISLPPKTTPKTTETNTITTTEITTDCPPITVTYTELETITEIEKETVTVTVKANPTSNINDDSKCAGKYAQCGGEGFTGTTCCKSGLTCHRISRYFSQCD